MIFNFMVELLFQTKKIVRLQLFFSTKQTLNKTNQKTCKILFNTKKLCDFELSSHKLFLCKQENC